METKWYNAKGKIIADLIGQEKTVLDCGCGEGVIARLLEQQRCRVWGIDIDPLRINIAEQFYEQVIVGDLEEKRTFAQLGGLRFDVVLFSDILEHVRYPERVLTGALKLLTANGFLVVSLPNTAYWKMRLSLLLGKWEYRDEGILDRTHIHFYTLKTSLQLFRDVGLRVAHLAVPHDVRRWRRTKRVAYHVLPPSVHAACFVFKLVPEAL